MSPWVMRGLRDGVATTRWPRRADAYADGWRGPAVVRADVPAGPSPAPAGRAGLASLCPAGAISARTDGRPALDAGRCVLCGRCVSERPDLFAWSQGAARAALTRQGLVTPPPETQESLAAARAALRARTAALRRSVHLRHVDAGSDGSEEQEIAALLNPVYDIHRLGLFFTASPRHADVLLVTGAGAHGMAAPLRRTYQGMPEPKVVVAVGADAISGGLLDGSYAAGGGVAAVIPVDVWVPGSPPPPFAIMHGLLAAVGRLPGGDSVRPAGAGRGGADGERSSDGRPDGGHLTGGRGDGAGGRGDGTGGRGDGTGGVR